MRAWLFITLKIISMITMHGEDFHESGTRKLAKFDTFKEVKVDE